MIGRLHARWRRASRYFSRSEWMSRLLGLRLFAEDGVPGLVLIQIDGFSHQEFQRALKRREMPFMARLLRREDYEVRRMYPGLPSNTPAVQGELFYGVPCVVPAFSFFDRRRDRICKMFETQSALEVEAELSKKGEPLLKGGSSYGNIFSGGASEPRWCFTSMGWGSSTKAANAWTLLLIGILNFYGFARAIAFGLLELLIGAWDAIRGVWKGEGVWQESKYVLSRVGMCILLREWTTQAAKMDVSRGMPIVHLNFVGYDEQAHRRGPDSAFAHWVLKGIDDAVKRVWRAAKGSRRRHYEVWIYSDHGQVRSVSYQKQEGTGLKEKVWSLWHDPRTSPPGAVENTIESLRIRLLGESSALRKLFPVRGQGTPERQDYPVVTAQGPLAHVYLEPDPDPKRRRELACALAKEGGVPLVVETASEPLRCWTSAGEFSLPRDADEILGKHPFRQEILADLERLRRHGDAGDLMLFGWKKGIDPPITFANENGSHGGISPQECSAFVAMPRYLERELLNTGTLRPGDIYRAARVLQGRASPAPVSARIPARTTGSPRIRVMTYNVHSCIGMDQRHDPRRIARVIAHYHPDVVALQELDTGHDRSGGIHQARQIAEFLQFEYRFHAVREVEDEQFGNAILSRLPLKLLRAGGLPSLNGRRGSETRGALWVEVDVEGLTFQILNTHFGLWPRERLEQARTLLGDRWLGGNRKGVPVVLCGDLNCGPRSPAYRLLRQNFADCQLQLKRHKPRNTWFTRLPLARIDHILVSEQLTARQIHVPSFHLAAIASDHFPLVADIGLQEDDSAAPRAPWHEKERETQTSEGDPHVA